MLTHKEMESLARVTGELIRETVAPLLARIDELEKRSPLIVTAKDMEPVVQSMQSVWALDFERRAQVSFEKAIERLPVPKEVDTQHVIDVVADSIHIDEDQIRELCDERISKAISLLPKPRDGHSVTVKDVLPLLLDEVHQRVDEAVDKTKERHIATAVAEYIKDNPAKQGKDGTSVTVDQVMPVLMQAVEKMVAALPAPAPGKDGSSVTVADIAPLLSSMQAEWALDFEKRAQGALEKAVDRLPTPKDGKDAFSLDDFDMVVAEDGRTVTLSFVAGEHRIERRFKGQWPIYRGVWKADMQYDTGDNVTWGGSTWVAMKDSKALKPGEFVKEWRLAVKRGQNGKSS